MADETAPIPEPQGPDPTVERGEANVAAALAAFETYRDELNALLCEVRDGETARAKKISPAAADLARGVSRMADEWVRLEQILEQAGEKGRAHAKVSLDLARARAEVCRRLAKRRDAGQ
ncbi:MAG: hypothetical protein AAF646_02600 [Pseudomonadota bacterium]